MSYPDYDKKQGEPYYGNQPPQQYPQAQPYVPQAPPKKGMATWLKVLLIIGGISVLLCGGGFVACTALVGSTASEIDKQQKAKVSHVSIAPKGCNVQRADEDFLPNVKVDLVINNTGKNQETYFIDVFITNSANERVGNGTAMVTDVRPGQTVKHTEMVPLTKKVSGKITCSVDKVN